MFDLVISYCPATFEGMYRVDNKLRGYFKSLGIENSAAGAGWDGRDIEFRVSTPDYTDHLRFLDDIFKDEDTIWYTISVLCAECGYILDDGEMRCMTPEDHE